MNCYQCGIDIGQGLGLCEACKTVRMPPPLPDEEAQAKPENRVLRATSFLSSWEGIAIILVGGFLLSFIVVFATHKGTPLGVVALSALQLECWVVGLCMYARIWIEAGLEEPMVALLSFFLVASVYRLVFTYPERLMKPFIVHVGALAVATLCHFALLYVSPATPAILQHPGMSLTPLR